MNAVPDNIIVNSCQYTPVYLIQDPSASQGQSYFLAQSIEEPKPINDNLKSFYENSGNLENSFISVNSCTKPRILKKQEAGVVGNNLKLASFLLPKNENSNKLQYVVNNVILKPNVTLSSNTHTCNTVNNTINNPINNIVTTTSTINTVPRLNMDSKIVKLKDTTFDGTTIKTVDGRRYNRVERISPKIKPKEIPPVSQAAPSKHTSVQLLKLGETYHSLNQLSDEQMKMVTQALKIFSNPEKIKPEPAYDPVTNTKFIYKVVSPKDLTVVGKNKITTKERILRCESANMEAIIKKDLKKDHLIGSEHKKETLKNLPKKESFIKDVKKEKMLKDIIKNEIIVKDVLKKEHILKHDLKKENIIRKNEEKILKQKAQRELEEELEMAEEFLDVAQPKTTRSGRKVKLPKLSIPQGSKSIPQKSRKKNTYVSCFQCGMVFPSLYRLQKHYEMQPTHIPVKIHSNLFHCLLAIVKSGTDGDRTNIFIQQLEQLIVKLRSLLPCVLRSSGQEGKVCTISEDVGRLLGVKPGKYHLDIDALSCVKNKDGFCSHKPPPPVDVTQEANGNQSWITMNNEDILANTEVETEDCARINSVEKWPTVNKRIWKQKQQKSLENAKRMKLNSETCDTIIELGTEDLVNLGTSDESSEILGAMTKKHKLESPQDKAKRMRLISENGSTILELGTEDLAKLGKSDGTLEKQKQQVLQENSKPIRLSSENGNTIMELGVDDLNILGRHDDCLQKQSAINEQGAEQKAENNIVIKIEPYDVSEQAVCANIVEEEPCKTSAYEQSLETAIIETGQGQKKWNNHAQFHSTHFDIRSSPIKPTSTIFRKFRINPDLLAKYETQIIRSIETVDENQDRDKNMHCPTVEEVLQTSETTLHDNVDILHDNENVLHASEHILNTTPNSLQNTTESLPNTRDLLHTNENTLRTNESVLPNSSNILHTNEHILRTSPDILCENENVLQTSQDVLQSSENVLNSQDVLQANDVRDALVNDDTLQEIFRDEDLSAVKESFILDRELKDWILNRSNDEKSEDGFNRSNSVIEPALLHVRDDEIKPQLSVGQKVDSPTNDNHDESSVLNFLDTLATDCLSYPGTEIRTNNGDFQLDLFSFHSS